MSETYSDLDQLAVTTIRMLALDTVQRAGSGHPGLPLGAAPMAYVLWTRFLRHSPHDPAWPDRDRFVLSAGHGSALLYSLLHLSGYDLSLDDLRAFRKLGSRTPGHPERGVTPGVEVTTGPLGQGFANAVGMAIAEAYLGARFNRPGRQLFGHYTYGICGDGDLMEGISAEAASLAGHLRLGKLILLYDDNHVSLDGPTRAAFTENVPGRFSAYGWHTQMVTDGEDLAAIEAAIHAARADGRPSLIVVRTVIGRGSPQQGTSAVHGSPLSAGDARRTKEFYGWDPAREFYVPASVYALFAESARRGAQLQMEWDRALERYGEEFPESAEWLRAALRGDLPTGWDAALPTFAPDGSVATRDAAGRAIEALHTRIPWLVGGSADLSESTRTPHDESGSFQAGRRGAPVLWFGVREHAMGGVLNGLAAHGGVRPYGGTFFTFSDYMRGAIRVAAISRLPVTYIFTHDSVGVGEDGPTHQPVEQLAALRAMPGLTVLRPADAGETMEALRLALESKEVPTALVLSRQKLPVLDRAQVAPAAGLRRGAYTLLDTPGGAPDVILMASGSEVSLAVEAHKTLAERGFRARVVSFPSWELFEQQEQVYRDEVLPPGITARIAVEAGVAQGWHRWVGERGAVLSIEHFGASAPAEDLLPYLGLTGGHVVAMALRMLGVDEGEDE